MSRRRRILLAALAALALLVAFAPLFARTDAARRFVAGRVSKALGRPVEIESLEAGWTSGVTLLGLVVRNDGAEFRGAPFLEARSVRLENALPSLVFSGATSVAIDGLKVRIEEHAGGRTNVDDLVKGLATPKPRAKKREVQPFRLALRGASVQVRRLVRRPQPRPVDPFREDPVILDAGEGLVEIRLDGDLTLETTPEATALDLAADVAAAGRRGRAEIAISMGPRGPSGRIRLEGIDLALLEPFVKGIEGRIELRAEGSPESAEVKLRVEALKASRIDEAWADLSFRVRRDGDGVAFDALTLRTASGAFSLDGKGAWPPKGIELRAVVPPRPLGIDMDGPLRLELSGGPELKGTLAAPDVLASFDATVRGKAVEFSRLDAKAFSSTLSARGEAGGALRLSGRADVDLADLSPLLREGASLEGRLAVPVFALDGWSLKADATVTGLRARGLFAEDLELDRGELHLDATLSADRDVLRVARAQLDGLSAEGTVRGLKGHLRADGTVRGTIALNPLYARLLGLRDVRGLRGQMTVDVAADDQGIGGRASIEGLHVETGRSAFDLARVSAEGSYRDGKAEVRAKAPGLALEGSLAGGKGAFALDLDAIEQAPLLAQLLPRDLDLRGPVKIRADFERGPWSVKGTVESNGLTARYGARGVEGERVRLSFRAREEEVGWLFDAPELVLEGLGVKASLGDGFLGRDGTRAGRVSLDAPLDRIATLFPEARAPEGRLTLAVLLSYDGTWTFSGEAHAEDISLVLAGERTPGRTVLLEFDATPAEGAVAFRRLRLVAKSTEIDGTATLGRAVALRMKGRTKLEEIAPFAPMFSGSGEVLLDEIALDLAADGRLVASASMRADSVRAGGGRLQKALVRSRVEGRLARGALEDARTDLSVTADRAARGNILAEGLSIREKGSGGAQGYALGARVDAARLTVGATSWEQVGLDVTGRLDRLLAERPPTGLRGKVSFHRWHLGPFLWEDAEGEVFLDKGVVVVRDLVAGLHGGTVRAHGRLTPVDDRLSWQAEADAKGIVLTEEIGNPLSFVVPFLRVEKEAGKLAGRADLDLRLSADDTTDAAIFRTLLGGGKAHLYDIEARNSILLPLLSLRLDKAILREPFRFKDLEVAFSVGAGAIRSEPFELAATPFGIRVKEAEVSLDGKVNVLVIPGIVPLRVRGTLDDPEVRPAPLAPFR